MIAPRCDGRKAMPARSAAHRLRFHAIQDCTPLRIALQRVDDYSSAKRRYAKSRSSGANPDHLQMSAEHEEATMGILWIVIIGFVAGIVARLLSPGPNKPSGFILTTILGIVGAFVATFVGQAIGWYRADQGAGFIGAFVGAFVLLFIWNRLVASGMLKDAGFGPRT
jgi:uncharacterized membrane protein YeaQ/YmgE (transglycosylase-associated protein family)